MTATRRAVLGAGLAATRAGMTIALHEGPVPLILGFPPGAGRA